MKEQENHLHLNKAINHIIRNFTDVPNLEEVSKISGFSKFHFHRLFKAYTGETLHQFIKRIRLERAAFLLVFQKHRSITDVALSCGFSSSQNFATAFKKHFNSTPKSYKEHKKCQGILVTEPKLISQYNDIQLKYIDSFNLAYQRTFRPYNEESFTQTRYEFLKKYPNRHYISIFWDDPTITLEKNCKYDYGYLIENPHEKTETEILSLQTMEARTYIILSIEFKQLRDIKSVEVWQYLYTNWLPRHGYVADTLFC
ncbi:MAG TPA: AraC family transcriptional regulator, partial [Campylobacterales bacterium]|nr:AraC family transcriptional regulator [Campylobacterales bacterium]